MSILRKSDIIVDTNQNTGFESEIGLESKVKTHISLKEIPEVMPIFFPPELRQQYNLQVPVQQTNNMKPLLNPVHPPIYRQSNLVNKRRYIMRMGL